MKKILFTFEYWDWLKKNGYNPEDAEKKKENCYMNFSTLIFIRDILIMKLMVLNIFKPWVNYRKVQNDNRSYP